MSFRQTAFAAAGLLALQAVPAKAQAQTPTALPNATTYLACVQTAVNLTSQTNTAGSFTCDTADNGKVTLRVGSATPNNLYPVTDVTDALRTGLFLGNVRPTQVVSFRDVSGKNSIG